MMPGSEHSELPKYGWKVRLDHKFPEGRDQKLRPRLKQLPDLLPLFVRYLVNYVGAVSKGKRIPMDYFKMLNAKPMYGVPLGGIGSGTIGRGFRGEFCRFQMLPGLYHHNIVLADQFIVTIRNGKGATVYQKVLASKRCRGNQLSSWDFSFKASDAHYCGLFPRSWTVYSIPEHHITLTCRQISPVMPNEYKDSSLPCGVFVWTVKNEGSEDMHVSIALTFKNGTGSKYDKKGECWSQHFDGQGSSGSDRKDSHVSTKQECVEERSRTDEGNGTNKSDDNSFADEKCALTGNERLTSSVANNSSLPTADTKDHDAAVECAPSQAEERKFNCCGAVLHQTLRGNRLRYCVAVRAQETSSCDFDPNGTGESLWRSLKETGSLRRKQSKATDEKSTVSELGIAVCGCTLVKANSSEILELALSWDMANINFREGKEKYKRRYTRWFNHFEAASWDIAQYALENYSNWERSIEAWQNPILDDDNLPNWFKSALFNELYYITDGGSVWLEIDEEFSKTLAPSDPRIEYGRFAYLESHEYLMYNTYDVHFYASWALIMLWPQLQKSLQYDMAMWTLHSDPKQRTFLNTGRKGVRKVDNSVPHDVGNPAQEPFAKINSYNIHDVSRWKDLNLKFVLQVYRDFVFLMDKTYLTHMWPVCKSVIARSFSQCDASGLISNDGDADQTYDAWIMHGPSAYCCSLWLAALACMCKIASIVGDEKEESFFREAKEKARKSYYEKLWNSQYFNFDSCGRRHSTSIIADQLVGHWYLKLVEMGMDAELYPSEVVLSVLKTIYEKNVIGFCGGTKGAVNGIYPDGSSDTYSLQSEEVWTGVSYAVAATMIANGMMKEGFHTAEGVYRTVYETIGLGFQTPEAFYAERKYRAVGYMRPLSIWSMLRGYNQAARMQK